MSFKYVDLFAGVGGFHAALSALGGECNFVSEIDTAAAKVYDSNWGDAVLKEHPADPAVHGDINLYAPQGSGKVTVPAHDVLAAGFPCQPFSKSGAQHGVRDRTRGTLFENILRVLDERRPKLVFLENVRNLAGPNHRDTFKVIITALREIGYRVSDEPTVFSPHLLPPSHGGSPQIRERVFILAVYVGREKSWAEKVAPPFNLKALVPAGWSPQQWSLDNTPLPWNGNQPLLQSDDQIIREYGENGLQRFSLTPSEKHWIDVWDDFVSMMLEIREGKPLPGHPLWADHFRPWEEVEDTIPADTPGWKRDFLRKNAQFYDEHPQAIQKWLDRPDGVLSERFPASRRKLEWQAQDEGSLWDCIMHLRPSGIRAKKPTYVPALVAITQTSIVGSRKRRLTPREAARLQGFPDWFDISQQNDAASYKQFGNAVNAGAIYFALRAFVKENRLLLPERLRASILGPSDSPTVAREALRLPIEVDLDAQPMAAAAR